jgi:hypothetical protein
MEEPKSSSKELKEPKKPVCSQNPLQPDPECHIAMTIKGQVNEGGRLKEFLQEKKHMRTDNPTHDILVNAVREVFRKKRYLFGERSDDPGKDHVQVDCSIWIGRPTAPMDAKWENIPFSVNGWHLITDENMLQREKLRMDQSKYDELKDDESRTLELLQEQIHRHDGKTLSCCKSVSQHIGDPFFCCPPTQCTIKLRLPIVDQRVIKALEPYATVSDLEWLGIKTKPSRGNMGDKTKSMPREKGSNSTEARYDFKRHMVGCAGGAKEHERELLIEVSEAKRRKILDGEEYLEMDAAENRGDIWWEDWTIFNQADTRGWYEPETR